METKNILNILRIIAWIGYIGSIIGLVITFILIIYSCLPINYDFTKNFQITERKLYYDALKNNHLSSLMIYLVVSLTKIYLLINIWKRIKETLSNIDILKPFKYNILVDFEKIALFLLGILCINYVIDYIEIHLEGLLTSHYKYNYNVDFTQIFAVGIVYLFSKIYNRGIEIQEENDLTV